MLRAPKQRGFTLLEVLVALTVFTLGLLALGLLQAYGMRLNSDSLLRTLAAIQANDMIDRIRANSSDAQLGTASVYNNPNFNLGVENLNCLGKDSGGNNANVSCTPAQMAQYDFFEWYANIKGATATSLRPAIPALFPNGNGIVCIDSTPNDGDPTNPACDGVIAVPGVVVYTIKIWWTERKDAQNPGVNHRYVTSFSLT